MCPQLLLIGFGVFAANAFLNFLSHSMLLILWTCFLTPCYDLAMIAGKPWCSLTVKRLRTVNYIIGNLHLTGMPLQNRMNELIRIEWGTGTSQAFEARGTNSWPKT
jgi:hypothetical protein